jgi:hypothetical protein
MLLSIGFKATQPMTSVPSLSNNKQSFGDVYSPGYSILAQMIGATIYIKHSLILNEQGSDDF